MPTAVETASEKRRKNLEKVRALMKNKAQTKNVEKSGDDPKPEIKASKEEFGDDTTAPAREKVQANLVKPGGETLNEAGLFIDWRKFYEKYFQHCNKCS